MDLPNNLFQSRISNTIVYVAVPYAGISNWGVLIMDAGCDTASVLKKLRRGGGGCLRDYPNSSLNPLQAMQVSVIFSKVLSDPLIQSYLWNFMK